MGGSSQTSKQKVTIPAEIRKRGSQITTGAMNAYFDPAARYQAFQGDRTGALNNLNGRGGRALGQYNQSATNYQPYFNRADQGLTQANQDYQSQGFTGEAGGYDGQDQVSGPNFSQEALQRFMNPYQDLVIDAGLEEIAGAEFAARARIGDEAGMSGAFGGSRHGLESATNTQNFAQTGRGFLADTLNAGYAQALGQYNTDFDQGMRANAQSFNQGAQENQQNFNQRLQADTLNDAASAQNFGQANSLSQLLYNLGQSSHTNALNSGKAFENLGNIWTQNDQTKKDKQYEAYLRKQEWPMEIYERLAAINAMQPHNRTSTTTTSQEASMLGPLLSGGGSLLTAFASDERLKEDITDLDPEDVLASFADVPPKSYRYTDEALRDLPGLTKPGTRHGFMAQDLEEAFGKPQGPTIGGYKVIDLSQTVGQLVAAVHGLEKRTRKLRSKGAQK